MLGWSFTASVLLSAVIVLVYTFLGGLTSAIYNEVLQFFLIVLGFAPLAILAVIEGGWMVGHVVAASRRVMTHSWKYMGDASQNPMGVEIFGMVAGLGFVLSFGYWCTDFLVVQRAMAANRCPPPAGHPHCGVSEDVYAVYRHLAGNRGTGADEDELGYTLPPKGNGYDYDQALTTLMAQFYPSGMLGVGLTALMASFMSGMAGNVTAFNTVGLTTFTRATSSAMRPTLITSSRPPDDGGRHRAFHRDRIPGAAIQQHHGSAAAGIRVCERAAVRHVSPWHVLEAHNRPRSILRAAERNPGRRRDARTDNRRRQRWLARRSCTEFPSTMAQNFWIAIFAWSTCFIVTILVSLATRPKPESELQNLVYGLTDLPSDQGVLWYKRPGPLAIVVSVMLIALNFLFW